MLFDIRESFRSALLAIRAHGFRSFLTTLGIIIGVAAVIAMVSIIQGLSQTINAQLAGLGSNSILIQAFTPQEQRMQGKRARITPEDMDMIKARVDGIASITPFLQASGFNQISYGANDTTAPLYGSTYAFQDVQQYTLEQGRFVSISDDTTRRRVVAIGQELKDSLELPDDPVGEYISIGQEWFKVIGVMEPKGQMLGQNQDNFAVMPFNTMRSLNGNQAELNIAILLTVSDINELSLVEERIRRVLRQAHNLTSEEDDFQLQTSEEMANTVNTIIGSITVVMGGIVSISLLVGGIGIMNIMLVSVTERTREIGICKAIGAKRYQILLQFLFESSMLCVIGGLIGLAIGFGLGTLIANVIPDFPPAHVPLWAMVLAIGFSGFVGVIFGIVPAAKAANLDPIEALRYE